MTCHAIHRGGRRHGRVRLFATTFLTSVLASGVAPVLAEDIPEVVITAPRLSIPADARLDAAGDTAKLLSRTPGLNLISNGGVSSLPDIHGLGDDRLKILVDGMETTSACSNHMNPPLSYIDSSRVEKVEVWSGITPVSAGGDNIGGVISVKSAPPVFAGPGEGYAVGGRLSAFYKSVNDGVGASVALHGANGTFSLGYDGSWAMGRDYYAGGDHRAVLSTLYEARNHALTFGARHEGHLLVLEAGQHDIPYQGFSNQRMDMTGNRGVHGNGRYEGEFAWGKLEARGYWQQVKHAMDQIGGEKNGKMPMRTDAIDLGYAVKGDIRVSDGKTIRVGQELHRFLLDDWWPPVAGSMSMAPNTFKSINGGSRDVISAFAEWEEKWAPQWTTLLGVRSDTVLMDTGNVAGYVTTGTEAANAAAFNAKNHAKTDFNFDLTALVRFEPNAISTNEFGYARKSRSPNLYERYSWSTTSMDSSMINWFGDANGYVGDPGLRPEVAHTVSTSFALHDSGRKEWAAKVTPYFTYIADYIGVDWVSNSTTRSSVFPLLKFANHDAMMSGVDVSGSTFLARETGYGDFKVSGMIGWLHGEMVNTGKAMYHVMPINGKAALEHGWGGWTNAVEAQLVGTKAGVDPLRREPKTPGYALLNLRSGYEWENFLLNLGIDNVFDKRYYHPLGGVDYSEWRRHSLTGQVGALPAPGRSFNAGVTVKF
ncbi:TonB-dependent receptor [Paramagnetospirillum magneticum]|uniref:Outer membrane receptor protein n=1 Tax=Paramagnetospirillum magneticum (strain ATCC 700264 / AMB-1) TaxID=342108 RepID=Q2W9Y1_PARM1|nr:TonB-dependent receptor [Paramagnetospirillum magneticum]BAE49344.1 Outer membrane receptor protein [Paramagnetospirillum magneticum AMB-1]